MGLKVALASSDGVSLNEHFGRAGRFVFYEHADGEWRYLGSRDNQPACSGHEHSDDLLERTVELIADCQAVAVDQIGPTAIDLLLRRRILPFMLGGSIEEALKTLENSRRFINLKPRASYARINP